MNALQAYRIKNSWSSITGDDDTRETSAMDWSELPDYQDVQQSVSKGWSDLRQAVVNRAPTSLPKAPAFTTAARKPSAELESGSEVHQSDGPNSTNSGGSAGGLWGRVTEMVHEQWEVQVTHRNEVDEWAVNSEGDTHLIQVMKEYHVSKAKTSDDLPAWLFPPTHRKGGHVWDDASPTRRTSMTSSQIPPPGATSNSLRDIFDAPPPAHHAQQTFPRPSKTRKGSQDSGYESSSSGSFSNSVMTSPPSRAATRLQSMKRERPSRSVSIERDGEQEEAALIPKQPVRPPVQVRRGLPSRTNLKG